ncbi:MAG TPA: hypothetical protein PKB10_01900 [Tepidisphaeraceae bacterium]|nr:hypothetical protein [Tepidisphaeraceae bacterium]
MRQVMFVALLGSTLLAGCATRASAIEAERDWFDPQRHMRVAEVKPGMKGYGLSVFRGHTPERFDVEVVSVLHNLMGPKQDVVLIRASGMGLEQTGSIAGMSGSPIWLTDEAGRDRMIGAFAYGWALAKEPLAGVQPIESMFELRRSDPHVAPQASATSARVRLSELAAFDALLGRPASSEGSRRESSDDRRLRPLGVPVALGGFSPNAHASLHDLLAPHGLTALAAGAAPTTQPASQPAPIGPGSSVAVAMMTGDLQAVAIGTVTEVIGDRVWAFGHPFNGEGDVALPIGPAEVMGIVPLLSSSFKIGSMHHINGTLTVDGRAGVVGQIGPIPEMSPVRLTLHHAHRAPRELNFQLARHRQLAPMLLLAAVIGSLSIDHNVPDLSTLDVAGEFRFQGGRVARFNDRFSDGMGGRSIVMALLPVLAVAGDNPFQPLILTGADITIRVAPTPSQAQLTGLLVPRRIYQPGQLVEGQAQLRTLLGGETLVPFAIRLPRDLKPGDYSLTAADYQQHLMAEIATRPSAFTAESIDELFAVINTFYEIRRDRLYLRLDRSRQGVSIGRSRLPDMPSSRRQVLERAGRSDVTLHGESIVTPIPLDYVLSGAAEFSFTVEPIQPAIPPAAVSPDKVNP